MATPDSIILGQIWFLVLEATAPDSAIYISGIVSFPPPKAGDLTQAVGSPDSCGGIFFAHLV